MKHVAAYALLVLGGTPVPEPDQVAALLKEAGVTADKAQIDALAAQFKGKGFHEIVAEGLAKIGSSGPAAAGPAAAADKPAAAKKESVKSESEEEVAMDGLFGGEDDEY
jgi:ribosomal protein L12E/L44/L45/RPP1/RPP2